MKVRSFTLTDHSLSLCIAKEVEEMQQLEGVVGIDRNLRNVTVGNAEQVTYYDVSKAVEIAETTRSIVRSFKRNDVRIRKEIAAKYGQRRQERVRQILNRVSKSIVAEARRNRQAIAFEDISGIRKLYREGQRSGKKLQRTDELVAVPRAEEAGGIQGCMGGRACHHALGEGDERHHDGLPACGERLQGPVRDDSDHYRQLWCEGCKRWMDRDLVAVMNISRRAWLRFGHAKGGAGEAVKGNPEGRRQQVILRVDASKSSRREAGVL